LNHALLKNRQAELPAYSYPILLGSNIIFGGKRPNLAVNTG